MSDSNTPVLMDQTQLNVDAIMQAIRDQIVRRRSDAEAAGIDFEKLAKGEYALSTGGRFPAQLHEQVFQAEMLRDKTQVSLFVTPLPIPMIGGIVARVRAALHQVTLFYVNMSAQRQIAFNSEISKTVSQLVQALENERQNDTATIKDLTLEIQHLKQRIEAMERRSGIE